MGGRRRGACWTWLFAQGLGRWGWRLRAPRGCTPASLLRAHGQHRVLQVYASSTPAPQLWAPRPARCFKTILKLWLLRLSPLYPATARPSYAGAGQRVLLGAFWQDLLLQPGYLHEQVWRRARAPSCCPCETVLNPKPLMSHSDCSGPLVAAILARQNAVQDWRKLIGPTDANQAREEAPDRSVGRRKTVQRLGWKEGFSEVALLAVSCLLPPPSPSACAPAMAQTSSAMPCTAATRWPALSARRTFSSRIVCCPALLFLLSQTPPSEPPAIPQL